MGGQRMRAKGKEKTRKFSARAGGVKCQASEKPEDFRPVLLALTSHFPRPHILHPVPWPHRPGRKVGKVGASLFSSSQRRKWGDPVGHKQQLLD